MSDLDKCPVCDSENVEWLDEELFQKTNQVRHYFECEDCKSEWHELYEFEKVVVTKESKER